MLIETNQKAFESALKTGNRFKANALEVIRRKVAGGPHPEDHADGEIGVADYTVARLTEYTVHSLEIYGENLTVEAAAILLRTMSRALEIMSFLLHPRPKPSRQIIFRDLVSVARNALLYIDSIPKETIASFPAMPGFDRDWADHTVEAYSDPRFDPWEYDDEQASLKQGWGVWGSNGVPEIQRWGEDPEERFSSDREAAGFVVEQAQKGDPLAQKALRIVLSHNPSGD